MVKPIDMQVIIKNIDQVARTSKAKQNNPLAQQVQAKEQMAREIKDEITTIKEGKELEDGIIDNKDEKIKKVESEKKKKGSQDKKEKKKKRKGKDRNRGKIIDLEG